MRIWGNTDYKAVTDFIQQKYAHYRKFVVGHSVGALILGMNSDSEIFEKCCFVATQNTYFGHLKTKVKFLELLGFGFVSKDCYTNQRLFRNAIGKSGREPSKGVSDDYVR